MSYLLQFEQLIKDQLERVEKLKNEPPAVDFAEVDTIKIGFIDGDGIFAGIRAVSVS